MKEVGLACFFTLHLLFFCHSQSMVSIQGKVKNPLDDHIKLVREINFLNKTIQDIPAILDEEGNFSVSFPLDHPQAMRFWHGDEKAHLFILPGQQVYLEVDAEAFDESINYRGPHALYSTYLNMHYQRFEDSASLARFFKHFGSSPPLTFKRYTESILEEKMSLLDSMSAVENFLPSFTDKLKTRYLYKHASDLLYYQGYFQIRNQQQTLDTLPNTFFQILNRLAFNRADNLSIAEYRNFLKDYLRYQLRIDQVPTPDNKQEIEKLREIFEGDTERILWAHYLSEAIFYSRYESVKDLYQEFGETYPDSKEWKILEELHRQKSLLKPGSPVPDFQLQDIHGNFLSLSDLAGKVIYLDFWASWCKPCFKEASYAHKLEASFSHRDDLVFLYISLDESKERWLSSYEQMSPTGIHLFAGGWNSDLRKDFQIRGIPAYFMIDKEGKFLHADPYRPSSSELLIKQLAQALNP